LESGTNYESTRCVFFSTLLLAPIRAHSTQFSNKSSRWSSLNWQTKFHTCTKQQAVSSPSIQIPKCIS